MTRGWTSADLTPVGDDDTLWTIADTMRTLGALPGYEDLPLAVSEARVRVLTQVFGKEPQGKRRTSPKGTPGRYARVYRAQDMIELYEMLNSAPNGRMSVLS